MCSIWNGTNTQPISLKTHLLLVMFGIDICINYGKDRKLCCSIGYSENTVSENILCCTFVVSEGCL